MTRICAAFLDRDGVINRKMPDGDYVKAWEEFEFLPGAKTALALLAQKACRVIVVTNQRAVARGLMSEAQLQAIHARMLAELKLEGARVDAVYYCPHEVGTCDCRKPATGMFFRAQRDFPEIEFGRTLVIGDSLTDMQAGTRLGCHNVLLATGEARDRLLEEAGSRGIRIDAVFPSLLDAVTNHILERIGHR